MHGMTIDPLRSFHELCPLVREKEPGLLWIPRPHGMPTTGHFTLTYEEP